MESLPQNPEIRINPENFHPCICFGCKIRTIMFIYTPIWMPEKGPGLTAKLTAIFCSQVKAVPDHLWD